MFLDNLDNFTDFEDAITKELDMRISKSLDENGYTQELEKLKEIEGIFKSLVEACKCQDDDEDDDTETEDDTDDEDDDE